MLSLHKMMSYQFHDYYCQFKLGTLSISLSSNRHVINLDVTDTIVIIHKIKLQLNKHNYRIESIFIFFQN